MYTYIDTYGTNWFTAPCLIFGSYGGGGSIACANLRWIESQRNISVIPSQRVSLMMTARGEHISFGYYDDDLSAYDVVIVRGGTFGGKTAFINMTGDLQESVETLTDYPVFDDELVSQVEMEWEEQAWPDTLSALLAAAPTNILRDYFSNRIEEYDSMLFRAYRDAMDTTNTYPVPEYDQVYIDTDRIASDFWGNLMSAFKAFHKERWANKPYKRRMLYLPRFKKNSQQS